MSEAEVTPVEIARLAGVGRAAVSNWRRRHDDFPVPVSGTAASPRFALAEVESWLRKQGKLAELPAEEVAWQQLRAGATDPELLASLARAGELLRAPPPSAASQGAPRAPGRGRPASRSAPAPLRRALAELATGHGAAGAFELLLRRAQEALRLPRLPGWVADLMAALLGPAPVQIYDPACGTGGLLLAALARFPHARLRGDEPDPALRELAAIRIAAHHGNATLGGCGIRQAPDPPVGADALICCPPHPERDWAAGELAYDPRWTYGVPPRPEPELAWAQHALANLRPGGRAVLLLPPAVAARPAGRRIRAELLRRGALRAVVGLPPGAVPPHHLGLHLWVLQHPAPADRPDRVLLADLPGPAGPHPPAYTTGLITGLLALERGDEPPDLAPVAARAFRIMDLLDDEVDLSTTRRLRTAAAPVAGTRVLQVREQLGGKLERLSALLPRFEVVSAPDHAGLPMIAISELVYAGALVIPSLHPLRPEPEPGAIGPGADTDRLPVWRARDVIAEQPPGGWLPAGELPDDAVRLARGEVVAPVIGVRLTARVVTAAEAGAVLGPHLHLLRPDPTLLDPWFLAGFLSRDSNTHRAGSLGSIHRYEVRRAQVPRVPLDEQLRYGALFRHLAEFGQVLRAATDVGGSLLSLVVEGLAAGTIRPPVKAG